MEGEPPSLVSPLKTYWRSYCKVKEREVVPSSAILSVVVGLPLPPSSTRPEGEDQLQWDHLN